MNRRSAEGAVTWEELDALIESANGLCAYCTQPWDGRGGLEVDHIVPLSPRPGEPVGSGDIGNLACACRTCNRSKTNKPLDVWLDQIAQLLAA